MTSLQILRKMANGIDKYRFNVDAYVVIQALRTVGCLSNEQCNCCMSKAMINVDGEPLCYMHWKKCPEKWYLLEAAIK